MRYILTIAFLLIFSTESYAEQTICKIDAINPLIGFKAIAWDNTTKSAKVTDAFGKQFDGKMTLARKHDNGFKVNVSVAFQESYYGTDESEFIIFPVNAGYRVIGVGYVIRNGIRYLDRFHGNDAAECLSLK